MGNPDAVIYFGPTFVSIRNDKQTSSTANGHSEDIDDILKSGLFATFCRTKDGLVKPITIVSVDG